jgi:transcription initiation factor TFIIE subunit alpha
MNLHFLKSIVASTAGTNASGIVELLYGKKNINEFLISKKLKLTINQTRNILYRLADEGLVGFVRKKDAKKGGWYTYYWTLNSGKGLLKFRENLQKNIAELQQHLAQRRTGRFFSCKNCELEFTEEGALTNNYTCPECGQVLEAKDLSVELAQIEKDIVRLRMQLQAVESEVQVISDKETKARERRLHAEALKKQAERAAQKKARAKALKGKEKSHAAKAKMQKKAHPRKMKLKPKAARKQKVKKRRK